MGNYVVYHLHSDLSNATTNIDSVTKYSEYIERAKECGMTALGFSEHGNIMEWFHKKQETEAAGMKFLYGVECYLTSTLEEKIRDNYHCVLIAKNYKGFLELNRMVSKSYNRQDGHFYRYPRISVDELYATSDNIIITTACIGGLLYMCWGDRVRLENTEVSERELKLREQFLEFLTRNKHRCFLEVQHHIDPRQKAYNQEMLRTSLLAGIPLIAGTDTHCLNETHERGRSVLQKSKGIHFSNEENWDLKFKTYDELVKAYKRQSALPEDVYLRAIENTNVLADMCEEYEIDCSIKYPHIYDHPEQVFRQKLRDAVANHPYAVERHGLEKVQQVVNEEYKVYKTTGAIDFMLLQVYLREWEKSQGIQCGYGRGSVSGSMIAYLLGVTQMDSIKFNLNFFRFMNPSRVSLADIDTDYSGHDRDRVKEFLLRDRMGLPQIQTAEIITFNTIAMKGAIRDVCRALYKDMDGVNYLDVADTIAEAYESDEAYARENYPDVFEYVDIVNGTIVSIGTHPSGVLICDRKTDELIGLCSISTSPYPVTMLNMKELDAQNWVKLDALGLDNVGIINETCNMLGIERLTPDNTDLDDMDVWRSLRDDTTMIFQWESPSAQRYIKEFMSDRTLAIARSKTENFSMIKWMSFGNGLLRPGCASFRDSVAKGEFYDNGFKELNEFLAPEAGRIAMQETIMQFLVRFCGYSDAESDTVRRAIAKKKGTETLLPEIERRFIEYCPQHYNITAEGCQRVIKPFIQIIMDASSYSFSWNHSDAYSCTGYISAYLRYYYPQEFCCAALNTFWDDLEKTSKITLYAERHGIKVSMPKWGVSRGKYVCGRNGKAIYKGLSAVKYMSDELAEQMYVVSQEKLGANFMGVLAELFPKTCIDTRQLDILIKLDFFSAFGNQRELLRMAELFTGLLKKGTAKTIKRERVDGTPLEEVVRASSNWTTKSGKEAKSYTIQDMPALLVGIESKIKSVGMADLDDLTKALNFKEVMGYCGYITGRAEDAPKLFILDVRQRRNKGTNKVWSYGILTKSIGSGKETWWTVYPSAYLANPIKKDTVVLCKKWRKENGKYFTMTEYEQVV